ncbi:MAG: hypothetical protein AAGF59_00335 [Pseudomonadota bacterium]
MRALIPLFLVVSIGFASRVSACPFPPSGLVSHHTDLVAETQVIVLAEVVGDTDRATYDTLGDLDLGPVAIPDLNSRPLALFRTVEVLKGRAPDTFSLSTGLLSETGFDPVEDFDSHKNSIFWDKSFTRQAQESDCRMYPQFRQGQTYLLFIDRPHWRAYEEIQTPDDLWLHAVRRVLEDPDRHSGLVLGLPEWLKLSRGVFIGRIESCDGPTLSVSRVLHGGFEQTWRYTDDDHADAWPDKPCAVNRPYLVITYRDEPGLLPDLSATVLPILDGLVDFGPVMRMSEIEVAAFRIQYISTVIREMNGQER